MRSDPRDVTRIIALSRATYRKMVPLAAGVLAPFAILLSPAVGAMLMSVSTIVVAVNAQLLRRVRLNGPVARAQPASGTRQERQPRRGTASTA